MSSSSAYSAYSPWSFLKGGKSHIETWDPLNSEIMHLPFYEPQFFYRTLISSCVQAQKSPKSHGLFLQKETEGINELTKIKTISHSWWWTGKPGVLQSMESDTTERLNWTVIPLQRNNLFENTLVQCTQGFPPAQWQRIHLSSRRRGFDPWVRKIPWKRK